MVETLLIAARRYADEHADARGVARTPIPSLSVVRATVPGEIQYEVSRPLICFVLQGRMRVTMAHRDVEFGAGESLLLSMDVATTSQVTRASILEPYVALMLDLDLSVTANLTVEMSAASSAGSDSARIERTDAEVATAALQLMQLIRRPMSLSLLREQVLRELHYWLLAGQHGAAIRSLGKPDSAAPRIARTVAVIRAEFAKPLRVEQLAAVAGMSPSAFHQHFRNVTSMTPLQFQKQLRLIEARRLLLSEGVSASSAAFAVGYQSVSQFSRDYRRTFGLPPARETATARRAKERTTSHQRGPIREHGIAKVQQLWFPVAQNEPQPIEV